MLEDAAGIRRVVLACGTVDLRKGIDGLAMIIGDQYGQNPFESAVIYSITETARANNLNVYYYIRYLLTELIKRKDKDGNIDEAMLEPIMPWSKELPVECYSKRRQ